MSRLHLPSAHGCPRLVRWAMILTLIGVTCYIRWSGLTYESVWADEAFSIELAHQGWSDIVRGTAADQHPPVYYFMLKLWMIAGQSVFQLRYLSTISSVLEVVLVLVWGQKILGVQAGFAAGVLLVLSSLHVRYAQEVRMYSLVSLLCLLSSILLYRVIKTRKGLLAQATLNILALYTHNVVIFLIGTQIFLVVLHGAKERDWSLVKKWGSTQFLIGLFYLPWLFILYDQATQHVMTWCGPLTFHGLTRAITQLTSGNMIDDLGTIPRSIWLSSLMLVIMFGIWHTRSTRKNVMYVFSWFSVSLAGMTVVSQFVRFFTYKMLIWLLAPLFLAIGNGWQYLPKLGKVVMAGVIIGSLVFALHAQQTTLVNQDCRGVAQFLDQQVSSQDVVLFNASVASICVKVYGDMDYAVVTYPENYSILRSGYQDVKATLDIADRMVTELEREYQRLWLVEFMPQWWDPEGYIEERVEQSGVLEQEWPFIGLRVRYYTFPSTIPIDR